MEDIHGLKNAIDIPFFSLWEWAILVFLLTFLLFRIGHLMWQAWSIRRKKRALEVDLYKPKDPFAEQIQQLEQLIESEAFKDFAHAATELLKSHLSMKHQKNITDWTTTEVLLFTKSIHIDYHAQIKSLFLILDPVKYARQKVSKEKAHQALDVLKKHIKKSES